MRVLLADDDRCPCQQGRSAGTVAGRGERLLPQVGDVTKSNVAAHLSPSQNDFDIAFHPVQAHTQGRWLSIATACQLRVTLPPVELIRVGDVYFVRDGHHRISVARALGQKYIDAEVTAWQVTGPLHWERPVIRRGLRHQPA